MARINSVIKTVLAGTGSRQSRLGELWRRLTQLFEICDWLWHVKQLPLMEETQFQSSFSILLLYPTWDYTVRPQSEKKNTKAERNYNTSLFPDTRAVRGCFTHKQKVKSNVHIAWGFLFYFLAQRDQCYVTEQKKIHQLEKSFHNTHDFTIQKKKSIKIKKNHLSKRIIILRNIFPGSKVSTFRNAV